MKTAKVFSVSLGHLVLCPNQQLVSQMFYSYWHVYVCPYYQYGMGCMSVVTIQVKQGSCDFPVALGGDASSALTAAR